MPCGEDTHTLRLTSKLVDLRVGYAKWIRRTEFVAPHLLGSVNMMHAVASYLRRDISATPNVAKWIRLPAAIEPHRYPLQIRFTHLEGYRSGHNEAVLKTVWAHAHVGSNPTPSAI